MKNPTTEEEALNILVRKFVAILGVSAVLCPTFIALAWEVSGWFMLLAWISSLPLLAFAWFALASVGGQRERS